jgi:long-chain acyl-CoA synthetase
VDVRRFAAPRPAPQQVFTFLEERRSRPRFMVPDEGGDWRAVTWAGYAQAIRELALFLEAEGQRAGDRAAILGNNRVEWIEAALGAQAAGGVVVPIYPSSTADQVAYVAAHSDARVLFVDGEALLERVFERWPRYPELRRIVCLDDRMRPDAAAERARARGAEVPSFAELERKVISWSRARAIGAARDREDPKRFDRLLGALSLEQQAVMIYTSGTTGHPKGVPLTHANLGLNTEDWMETLAPLLDEGAVDLLWLPMSHIFGLGEVNIGNQLGWTSYLATPANVCEKIREVRPGVFMSVPSFWEKLAAPALLEADREARIKKLRDATGGRLRFCLSGGAGLKREVKELYWSAGILVIEGYGLTETSPTLTLNRPDAFRFDSVGKALPRVELRLAEDGEIIARGPNVFSGYHKDPEATRAAFTDDGWFKTGDVGRFTEDGFLQIVDRKKEILVTAGGKNVPPANIELRFRDDPFIAHLVVFGDGKHYLVAGVWLHQDAVEAHLKSHGVHGDARLEAIRALVQQRIDRVNGELASFETIKRFAVFEGALSVEGGFLTPTLKLRRKQVYQSFGPELEALYR